MVCDQYTNMLRLLIAAVGIAATAKYYVVLSSVAFHSLLRNAVKDGKDGVMVAFLDEHSGNHEEELSAFNRAARSWRCLMKGGVHMVVTGEDSRASFIAADLQQLHGFPHDAVPPIAVFWQGEKPVAWQAGNGSSDAAALGAIGAGGDGGGSNLPYFWSASALEDWGHYLFGVRVIRTGADVDELRRTAGERVALGFFASPCEGAALVFHEALSAHRNAHGGQLTGLPAALSSNLTLGHELCGLDPARGGVCTILDGKGARLILPEQVPYTATEVLRWMSDIWALLWRPPVR